MAVIDVPTGPASGSSFGDTAGVSAGMTQAQGFRLPPQRSEQEVMLAWKMNELFQRARGEAEHNGAVERELQDCVRQGTGPVRSSEDDQGCAGGVSDSGVDGGLDDGREPEV